MEGVDLYCKRKLIDLLSTRRALGFAVCSFISLVPMTRSKGAVSANSPSKKTRSHDKKSHDKLLTAVQVASATQKASANWSEDDTTALIEIATLCKAEAGDGGNFKGGFWKKAAAAVRKVKGQRGGVKTAQTCKTKWASVRALTLANNSSIHFHVAEEDISCRYDVDGQLGLGLE